MLIAHLEEEESDARESFADVTAGEPEHTFQTNILAMFHTCRAALEHMEPGSTIIINTASVQAYKPDPMLLDHAATKAAIVNFTTAPAQEKVTSFGEESPTGRAAPARRARSGLRLPGVTGLELRQRRDGPRHGRRAVP